MFKTFILGCAVSALIAGVAQARPASSHYHGYVKDQSAGQCQDAQLAACNREFGRCTASNIGSTQKVGFQNSDLNVSMLCTRFDAIGATVYSVSVSADADYGSVRDIVIRMKDYIQSQFRR